MGRELFSDTLAPPARPPRSKWTIAGSILFHGALVGTLLIVPLFTTLDVPVQARSIMTMFIPPSPRLPDIPPPPSTAPKAPPINVNPEAAPVESGNRIPTEDTPVVSAPGPVPFVPGGIPTGVGGRPTALDALQNGPLTLAAPPKPAPVRPGGDIKPPQRITYVPPVYPTIAQTAKIEGLVILEATIDEQGIVRDVRVLRSIPMLDKAAIESVSKWRYTPTRLNGVAVPIILTVTVSFSLK
jgi:protein TonB